MPARREALGILERSASDNERSSRTGASSILTLTSGWLGPPQAAAGGWGAPAQSRCGGGRGQECGEEKHDRAGRGLHDAASLADFRCAAMKEAPDSDESGAPLSV